jgi:hypothetical protein
VESGFPSIEVECKRTELKNNSNIKVEDGNSFHDVVIEVGVQYDDLGELGLDSKRSAAGELVLERRVRESLYESVDPRGR